MPTRLIVFMLLPFLSTFCADAPRPNPVEPVVTPQEDLCQNSVPDWAGVRDFSSLADWTYTYENERYLIEFPAQYPCVRAPDVIDPKEYRVIWSVRIPNLERGDIVKSFLTSSVTNDMPKPMFLAWDVRLTQSGPQATHSGILMTRSKGKNITPGTHHDTIEIQARAQVPHSGTWYLNYALYAASGELELEQEYLKIERTYADMFIEITKGNQ